MLIKTIQSVKVWEIELTINQTLITPHWSIYLKVDSELFYGCQTGLDLIIIILISIYIEIGQSY